MNKILDIHRYNTTKSKNMYLQCNCHSVLMTCVHRTQLTNFSKLIKINNQYLDELTNLIERKKNEI